MEKNIELIALSERWNMLTPEQLQQELNCPFTFNGRQMTVADLCKELDDFNDIQQKRVLETLEIGELNRYKKKWWFKVCNTIEQTLVVMQEMFINPFRGPLTIVYVGGKEVSRYRGNSKK